MSIVSWCYYLAQRPTLHVIEQQQEMPLLMSHLSTRMDTAESRRVRERHRLPVCL
jgi:hypothetical protein